MEMVFYKKNLDFLKKKKKAIKSSSWELPNPFPIDL